MSNDPEAPFVGMTLKQLFDKKGISLGAEKLIARIRDLENEIVVLKENEKKYSEELNHLKKITQEKPKDNPLSAEKLFQSAVNALKNDDPADAMGFLQALLLIEPGNIKAKTNLGVVYAQLGYEHRAMEMFRQVLEQDPGNQTAQNNLDILSNE